MQKFTDIVEIFKMILNQLEREIKQTSQFETKWQKMIIIKIIVFGFEK